MCCLCSIKWPERILWDRNEAEDLCVTSPPLFPKELRVVPVKFCHCIITIILPRRRIMREFLSLSSPLPFNSTIVFSWLTTFRSLFFSFRIYRKCHFCCSSLGLSEIMEHHNRHQTSLQAWSLLSRVKLLTFRVLWVYLFSLHATLYTAHWHFRFKSETELWMKKGFAL